MSFTQCKRCGEETSHESSYCAVCREKLMKVKRVPGDVYCDSCDQDFSEDELNPIFHVGGGDESACPDCGNTDLEEIN